MIWFVYRSHYEGPLGKLVRRLPDATVVDWFRRGWSQAGDDPRAWVTRELGTGVYGLDSIFVEARASGLPAPTTWQELRDLLAEHLYVEGEVVVDQLSVRVRTDDDEVALAYFFLDRNLVESHPDRLAYPLHGHWPLPDDTGGSDDAGGPEPATHVVLLTFTDGDSIGCVPPVRLPGVRLPGLAAYLRETTPPDDWPDELVVLRALADTDDLARALHGVNRWAVFTDQTYDTAGLRGDHAEAHRLARDRLGMQKVVAGPFDQRFPGTTRIEVSGHLAQMSIHMSAAFGSQQWFVFDDVWAASHPHLATSLLRYARSWDPLGA